MNIKDTKNDRDNIFVHSQGKTMDRKQGGRLA